MHIKNWFSHNNTLNILQNKLNSLQAKSVIKKFFTSFPPTAINCSHLSIIYH